MSVLLTPKVTKSGRKTRRHRERRDAVTLQTAPSLAREKSKVLRNLGVRVGLSLSGKVSETSDVGELWVAEASGAI